MKVLLYAALLGAIERRLTPPDRRAYTRDLETHRQLMPWARLVTGTDPTKRGGFGFVGPWIRRGYTETKTLTIPAVALVAMEHSRPQATTTYRTYHVAIIHSDGLISIVDEIETDNLTPGWSHRIMPAVAELLRALPHFDATHTPTEDGPWAPNRIRLTPLPPTAGWYP